jgi:vanillate O-demethylase monooxygenase subunit
VTDVRLTNTDRALRSFWHPVIASDDVPASTPVAVRLLGEPWVLVRIDGVVHALVDRCPHRRVPLSAGRVVDGTLECAYHGYRFAPDGGCVRIPALDDATPIPSRACVATAFVEERFGLVWLAPEPPRHSLLDDTSFRDPAFDTFVSGPFGTPVGAAVLTDNFLDAAHFPFLHAATFGADDDGRPDLDVTREGWTLVQRTTRVTGAPQVAGNVVMDYEYVVAAPFSVALTLTGPEMGTNVIWSFSSPVTDGHSSWWLVHAYDDLGHDPALIAAARDFQTRVGEEDLAILERMEDPDLALDPRDEVHTKVDRGTLEYRRMLRAVVGLTSTPALVS